MVMIETAYSFEMNQAIWSWTS